jgi:uncharacterized protein (DUF58 family)
MLTRQGWLAAGAAVALVVGGRILGLTELYALGGAAAALIAACSVLVGASRLDLAIARTVHPSKVHVGSSSRVELAVRNLARRRSPVLTLTDPVSGTRGAELQLAPLGVGEQVVAAYRLPTTRRGLLEIGPLEVTVSDPFGLSRVRTPGAPRTEVIVYPHVDPIRPLPHTSGHDPSAGIRQPNSLGRAGEDFYALRPYVVGDDLRRVHWPSTARHDELMVRQHELPWQGRTTIALDVRSVAHARETFEVAVSAAASLLTATARRADLVRLVTSAGTDSDFGAGADHLEAIMEHLAVVTAGPDGSLRQMVEVLGRATTGGALVVVLGDPPDDDLRAVTGLRPRYGSCTVVTVDPACPAPGAGPGPVAAARAPRAPAAPGTGTVRISAARPFPDVWSEHLTQLGASRQRSGSLARGVRA